MRSTPAEGPLPIRPYGALTRARSALLLATVVLGALGSAAVLGFPPEERTFAGVVGPVQLLMSVLVPLVGILLVGDLRRTRSTSGRPSVLPAVLTAVLLAELLAVVGVLFAATALALAPTSALDPWRAAALLVVGSLLAQLVAVLTGTGLGLLVPSRALAFVLTLLPVGLWLVLGTAAPLRAVRDWVTPYGPVRQLLDGTTTAVTWGELLVVLALWGLTLNVLGARKLSAGVGPAARSGG
jgi:hypothetical protein